MFDVILAAAGALLALVLFMFAVRDWRALRRNRLLFPAVAFLIALLAFIYDGMISDVALVPDFPLLAGIGWVIFGLVLSIILRVLK